MYKTFKYKYKIERSTAIYLLHAPNPIKSELMNETNL